MVYFLIFIFQLLYNVFKVYEIKYTYEHKIKKLVVNSIVLNILTLCSTYYSINHLLKGDIIVILFFILGAAVGKWFALTHFENYRAKILKLLNNEN
jgi:uncharacterized membrane protein YqgA involved in biofilm formation